MSSNVSLLKPEFSVRIVVCDHYLTRPVPGIDVIYSDFRGSDIKQVPVLRVFGSTPEGYKTCLHIHGVFPYFYVPCPTSNPEPQFLYQMAASLDKALNIAMKQAMSANQHVYRITLVKGLPFYGFHDKEHLYLKVFLYNPSLIKKAVELCSNGAILGQPFQPHESHLNFTLQFFIDFNLFGMSNIDLQTLKFRRKGNLSQASDSILESDETLLKPESMCYYEADCVASHIINRQRIGKSDGIENPGLEEVWNQEEQRRQQLNMSMASKSLSQGRLKSDETDSHYKHEQIFLLKMTNLIDKPVEIPNNKVANENVYYPAISLDGTQLFNAVDVSVHLPDNTLGMSLNETLRPDLDVSCSEEFDNTVVDEEIALNSSLSMHYSQVLLDNEDLDLLDVLKDMDENKVEEDSVLGTPADEDLEKDASVNDDLEYSQIFNEDTILFEAQDSKVDEDEKPPSWNDSFWEGANIPQLDGTCDDDHTKKVRKRKMRPFKLGLSRPKHKRKVESVKEEPKADTETCTNSDNTDSSKINNNESSSNISNDCDNISKTDMDSTIDEINVSRETLDSFSSLHLKKSTKTKSNEVSETIMTQASQTSIVELVNKVSQDYCNYDLDKGFMPVAGPSKRVDAKADTVVEDDSSDSLDSSAEHNDLGLMSFYNTSKLFDVTLDDQNESTSEESEQKHVQDFERHSSDEDIKLHYSETPQVTIPKPELITNIKEEKDSIILTPKFRPPTKSYLISTLKNYNIRKVKHFEPFYSNPKDAGDKVEIGQIVLKIRSLTAQDQKPFETVLDTTPIEEWRHLIFLENHEVQDEYRVENLKTLLAGNKEYVLEPLRIAPKRGEVINWMQDKESDSNGNTEAEVTNEVTNIIEELDNSQAIGLNEMENSISLESDDKDKSPNVDSLQITMQADGSFLCFGSEHTQNEISNGPVVEVNYLTLMILEVHTSVRGELRPNPLHDPIQAVFITVTNDCPPNHFLQKTLNEIYVVDNMGSPKHLDRCVQNKVIKYVNSELDIFEKVVESVKKHDPDIMCGYEIEMNSWGYLLERSRVLSLELIPEFSRITEKNRQKRWRCDDSDFESRIIGRILFNVWKLFRHELALSSYSFENCMYEILKERVPKYSCKQLSEWWNDESRIRRWIPVEFYLTRLSGIVRMLEKLDIINRTSELARLFGLQWLEVLSRGSQFRVESLMLRAARPLNLVALSPTVRQRAAMRAPEFLPLIFEPESRFYSDPVIVLDFQSLYPSMMIAYNYCFSTCIGRVQNINGDNAYEFGAWRLRIPKAKLETLVKNGLVHWSPIGAGFVKPSVRRGVLPALLRRILAARQAVKKSMKQQTDLAVKKAMHSRQLGLKLIANVTYGYTSANFSGRMPCVEVGDSVVAKGRETLERAIRMVQNNKDWNAKIVYGDTDSMFVLVPGGTRRQAFDLGQQIADAVTADNPSPVALKLEKVYQPCILQTKKRYVGYMYESPDQASPVFEAKGIETVRRDGCPAGVKLLQRSLCELFETGDISRVKRAVMSLLSKLVDGSLPPQELFFTREYHGPQGYRPGAAAPPNEIAKRLVSTDVRASPRTGERVSWLVCAGAPGLPLVRLARTPSELARDQSLRPHIAYYASRVLLPPLNRCFSLLGVNVFKWWTELSYVRDIHLSSNSTGTIAKYLWRSRCAGCGARAGGALCGACAGRPQRALAALADSVGGATRHVKCCWDICESCCGHRETNVCENTECPVLWRRQSAYQKLAHLQDIIKQMPSHLKTMNSFEF